MMPPTYSPSPLTTSYVIAVPKSTITHGPPTRSYAATELTSRSAPTSRGLSIRIGIPVRSPGPITGMACPR